ncbi:MAG: hypothetical protein U9P81_01365 [Euryarchaeota archaeon]|nr:hypothetical protein [Euryarchaeota archaeon]
MDATDSLLGILSENKVRLLIIFVTISLFLIALNGLFSPFTLYGGSWVDIQAEKPLNVDEMRQMVLLIEKELHELGYEDITVISVGDIEETQYILIQIAGADIEETQYIFKNISESSVLPSKIKMIGVGEITRQPKPILNLFILYFLVAITTGLFLYRRYKSHKISIVGIITVLSTTIITPFGFASLINLKISGGLIEMAIMMTIPAAIALENHVSTTYSVFFGKEKPKKSRMKDFIFLIVIVCAIRFITSVPRIHVLYFITPSDLLTTFFWIFPQAVISCFIVIVISGPAYVKIIHKFK